MAPRKSVLKLVFWGCCLALTGLVAPACDQGGSTGTVTRGGSSSSGDEGEREPSDSRPRDLEAPPGSHEPDPDDLEAESGAGGDTGSGTSTGPSAETTPTESPWGRPEGESGEPLPQRQPVSSSARDSYRRGVEAGQRGDTATARRAFEETLRTDPNAFRAAYNLGVLADREGQSDQALTYYRQALRVQADYERAAEGIVTIHVRRGQAAEAVAFVEPLARRWVRNLHLQAIYGEALIFANRPQDAIAAARTALRRDERFVPAMIVLIKANTRLGRTELAQSILDQAIAIDGANAELHFLKGRMQQEQNQLGPALQSYRRAVELRPDFADARMALALQMLAGANYAEAVQQFETVARLVSNVPEVYLGLGNAYRSTKQWEKSKNELERVVAVSPRNPEAHYGLALLYMEAGGEFPGLDLMASLQRAQQEFRAYRELMGPRLARDDQSGAYLEEIQRQIEREQRRIEREAARAQRERERAARQAGDGAAAQ